MVKLLANSKLGTIMGKFAGLVNMNVANNMAIGLCAMSLEK